MTMVDLTDILSSLNVVFPHSRTKEEALKELVIAVCDGKISLSVHDVFDAIIK